MGILDEHSLRSSKGLVREGPEADMKFCEHVHRNLIDGKKDSPIMVLRLNSKAARERTAMKTHDGFQVRHYAGDVTYTTKGWIDKNNDALVPEVEALLDDAKRPLTRGMADRSRLQATSTRDSVAVKYLGNLKQLLATLKQCSVHYIRCFNPNNKREAGTFMSKYVLEQVIQCGTVELVKIMHHGFPNRCFLSDLRERFAGMLPREFDSYKNGEFMEAVMLAFAIDSSEWTVGTRRLFLRAGQLKVLESLREDGTSASQELLKRIRLHFARKKMRSVVAKAKVLRVWLRSNRTNRLSRLITGLVKATFIVVRLMRWWGKTHDRLYPPPPPPEEVLEEPPAEAAASPEPETSLDTDVQASLHLEPEPPVLPVHYMRGVRAVNVAGPRLFVASNTYEQPKYSTFLSSQLDMSKPIGDTTLKIWQRETAENILYHDGKDVICGRLDPKVFIMADLVAPGVGGLDDLRYLDVHGSGIAFPVSDPPRHPIPGIVCMCQSRSRRDFATCDESFQVCHWKWLGTDQSNSNRFATKLLGACPLLADDVLGMCFLSRDVLPDRITGAGGVTLAMLITRKDQLIIKLVTIWQGSYLVECSARVDFCWPPDGDDAERLPLNVAVSFFQTTFSEKLLVLGGGVEGGNAIMRFWEVRTDAEGRLSLLHVEDPETSLSPIEAFLPEQGVAVTALLSMPMPVAESVAYDWLVFGDNQGTLYGFKLNHLLGGRFQVDEIQSGRFRNCQHTQGVPIRQIISCYGESPTAHHKEVQKAACSYEAFLSSVSMRKNTFFSLGDDGILAGWNISNQGWRITWTRHFQQEEVVCAHSSRLVPNILVRFDKASRRFQCHDTQKDRQGRTSLVSVGGA